MRAIRVRIGLAVVSSWGLGHKIGVMDIFKHSTLEFDACVNVRVNSGDYWRSCFETRGGSRRLLKRTSRLWLPFVLHPRQALPLPSCIPSRRSTGNILAVAL